MINDNSNTTAGFTMYRNQELKLLLPVVVAQLLTAQARQTAEELILAEDAKKLALEIERKIQLERNLKKERATEEEPGRDEIEVVSVEQMAILDENVEAMESSTQKAAMPIYQCLKQSRGRFRSIPNIDLSLISDLVREFENMAQPIEFLSRELELMAHLPPDEFQITPILLLGSPGIGKTAFAGRLAKVLGLPYSKVNGGEASFSLTGSHPTYTKAIPGLILKQIAINKSASPVILVDEIDKPNGERYPICNALLDLFEPVNATNFKDEFFQFSFDASKAIWILTANTTSGVPEPLLSRVVVFDIPMPDKAQRTRIIENSIRKLCYRTGHKIGLCPVDVTALAGRVDLDLRMVSRIVRNAFIDALRDKSDKVKFKLPRAAKTGIGFY